MREETCYGLKTILRNTGFFGKTPGEPLASNSRIDPESGAMRARALENTSSTDLQAFYYPGVRIECQGISDSATVFGES
jgi:hypothetical protein